MNIFIDCEWNDYGGELISMALCAETGEEFYEVLPCDDPSPWVATHVMPFLDKTPVRMGEFQTNLASFLSQFGSINIIADWPEDIAFFCKALIIGPGHRLNTPPMSMQMIGPGHRRIKIDADSGKPHNALHDACSMRKAVMAVAKKT